MDICDTWKLQPLLPLSMPFSPRAHIEIQHCHRCLLLTLHCDTELQETFVVVVSPVVVYKPCPERTKFFSSQLSKSYK